MPEGPEVETVRRSLTSVVGLPVSYVELSGSRVFRRVGAQRVAAALTGASFTRFDRFGKYLVAPLDSGEVFAAHLRMAGWFQVLDSFENAFSRHCHMLLGFADGSGLRYVDPRGFGELFVFDEESRADIFPEFLRLGPDMLKEPVSARLLAERFAGSRRAVKAVLLDQNVVAGLGNIYCDEALHAARIHPLRPASSLSVEDLERLAVSISDVLAAAVAAGGSTLSDGSYRRPDGSSGSFQVVHKVYGRAGRPCFSCGSTLEKTRVASRGTSFCPTCQSEF